MLRFVRGSIPLSVALVVAVGGAQAMPPPANPNPLSGLDAVPSPGLLNSGLLDFSRFDLRHSLSYSFSSSGYGSHSAGLWLSSIGYRPSGALRISADVGATINPMGDGPVLSENSFFLHSLNLDYRPSRNFMLHISYVNIPPDAAGAFGSRWAAGYGLGYRPWGSPLGLNR
jgi:hypothetical protein